jgi:hypothetical protein
MDRVKLALVGGLALTAVAVVLTLLQSPATIIHSNEAPHENEVTATTEYGTTVCQGNEFLPRDTTEIDPKLGANSGPRVHLEVSSDGRVLTSGQRSSGWSGRIVAIPVTPLSHDVSNATVCVSFAMHNETVSIYGSQASGASRATEGGKTLEEKMWIDYLRASKQSWASQLGSVFKHLDLGRTMTGSWIGALVLALVAGVIALTSTLVLKELR